YGFGLYLEDGLLAALYGQATPIMEKSPEALVLLSADIQFTTIDAAQLVFGETSFTNPPATTERQGVVELATSAETIAGTDTQRAVTPAG
ncbi:phage tail protein, partial [Cupriavidus sp. SIMBA_020]